MNCGSGAAICMAMSCTSSWKSSVRATKSDSQLTSTSTPSCAAGVDVAADHALPGGAAGLLAAPKRCRACAARLRPPPGRPWLPSGRSCTPSCPRRCVRGALYQLCGNFRHIPSLPESLVPGYEGRGDRRPRLLPRARFLVSAFRDRRLGGRLRRRFPTAGPLRGSETEGRSFHQGSPP